ncbi:MAG: hypothetical protein GX234_07505 [Clostridiales bacterium]|nr:hypothetical protein [Clostridiales bacterium]
MLSANATFQALRLGYNAIKTQTNAILNDVYDLDDYVYNETPIVFIGFPSDDYLRKTSGVYNYAINLHDNPVYLLDMNGSLHDRYWYAYNYLGINVGDIDAEKYQQVLSSDAVNNMNIWPESNSIKIIDGVVVVKLE